MFSLERLERVIIVILIATLIAGLGFAIYRKAIPRGIGLKQFDPEKYRPTSPDIRPSSKININTADAGELAALKGVGRVLAARIVAYRSENGYFISSADLKKVKGIGNALFDEIKDGITAE